MGGGGESFQQKFQGFCGRCSKGLAWHPCWFLARRGRTRDQSDVQIMGSAPSMRAVEPAMGASLEVTLTALTRIWPHVRIRPMLLSEVDA